MNKKTMYHVQLESDQPVELFCPRIPQTRADGEDDSIKRICVSDTVEGCLTASADFQNEGYIRWLPMNFYEERHTSNMYRLLFEGGHIGFLMRVYRLEVENEEIIGPNELVQKGLVSDAKETGEHWVLDDIAPTEISYVFVKRIEINREQPQFTLLSVDEDEIEQIEMERIIPDWDNERDEMLLSYYLGHD